MFQILFLHFRQILAALGPHPMCYHFPSKSRKFWTGILFTNGSSTLQWWVSKNIELKLWKSTFENQSGHQGQFQPILTLFPSCGSHFGKPLLFSLYSQHGLFSESKPQKPDKEWLIQELLPQPMRVQILVSHAKLWF